MYKTSTGMILKDSNMLSRSRMDDMLNNGWSLVHVDLHESAQEAYDRISREHKGMIVRIYSATTAVRGYYSKYAMVRWPKKSAVKKIEEKPVDAEELKWLEMLWAEDDRCF